MSEQKMHRSSRDWPTKASSPPSRGAMTCMSTAHIHVLGQKKLFYGNSQRGSQLHVPPAALSVMMLLGANAHQGGFFSSWDWQLRVRTGSVHTVSNSDYLWLPHGLIWGIAMRNNLRSNCKSHKDLPAKDSKQDCVTGRG